MTVHGPVRVLAVMPGLTPEAGAETSLAAVAPLLVASGFELHLAVLTPVQQLVPQLVDAGVSVHDLSTERGWWRRALAIRSLVRRLDADLVHATLHEAAVPAQLAAALTFTPVLVTWANTPVPPGESPQIGWIKRQGVRGVEMVLGVVARTRFHAVTTGVARVKRRELMVRARRVRVAERGRDPGRFAPRAPERLHSLRTELGLTDRHRVILAVGRQDRMKAHVRLVRAFDQVAAEFPDAVVVIAGREGSATEELVEARGAGDHGDRVLLLGHRDDVAELMQVAEVVVCSSLREGAAGALIEAMASGTPILTTRLEGLDDVMIDGVNARVVEAGALAAGLRDVLADPVSARARAVHAQADFAARFTVDRAAEALGGVYRWAAAR